MKDALDKILEKYFKTLEYIGYNNDYNVCKVLVFVAVDELLSPAYIDHINIEDARLLYKLLNNTLGYIDDYMSNDATTPYFDNNDISSFDAIDMDYIAEIERMINENKAAIDNINKTDVVKPGDIMITVPDIIVE